MAGNAYTKETKTWLIDSTGTLNAGGVEIQFIYFVPSAVDDDLVLTDNANKAWLSLKCRHDQIQPQYIPFDPPIKLSSLKVATIDGSTTATIQFRTDLRTD